MSARASRGVHPMTNSPTVDWSRVECFAPVASPVARVLILGSAPGIQSLRAGQYYGHPRNAFWPIMGELLGFAADAPYGERLDRLRAGGIALWDVMASCERPSSLDSAIVETSIVPNDFAGLFGACPRIERVLFNGAKAEASYVRYVLPALGAPAASLPRHRLPSTSPANAGWTFARKLAAWRAALSAW